MLWSDSLKKASLSPPRKPIEPPRRSAVTISTWPDSTSTKCILGLRPSASGTEPEKVAHGLGTPAEASNVTAQPERLAGAHREVRFAEVHDLAEQSSLPEPPDELRLIEPRHAIREPLVALVLDLGLRHGEAL